MLPVIGKGSGLARGGKSNGKGVKQHIIKQEAVKAPGKGQPNQNANNSPKTRLSQVLPHLLGRAPTKDDCVYEITEGNNMYKAVLLIPSLDRVKTDFIGAPAGSKKEAEQNAALQALNVMSKEIQEVLIAAGKIPKPTHDATPGQNNSPKTLLSQALPLLLGRSATKDDCVYEVTEGNGMYKAVLLIPHLDREKTDFIGAPAGSKKESEQNAALQALNMMRTEIQVAQTAHGKLPKTTHVETPSQNLSPKTRLSQVLPLLLGRSATKDDYVYEVTQEDGAYRAVLLLPHLDREKAYTGAIAGSKKDAEHNAALQALNVMAKQIKEVEKAQAEIKKTKQAEKIASLKAAASAKKAAKVK